MRGKRSARIHVLYGIAVCGEMGAGGPCLTVCSCAVRDVYAFVLQVCVLHTAVLQTGAAKNAGRDSNPAHLPVRQGGSTSVLPP